MKANGYFITIKKPNGNIVKRFVKRLGEVALILSSAEWSEVLIRPLLEKGVVGEIRGKKMRPIECVETGERFDSVLDASKHFGISYKAVWNSVRFGTSRQGYHFKDAKPKKEDERTD